MGFFSSFSLLINKIFFAKKSVSLPTWIVADSKLERNSENADNRIILQFSR